MLYSRPQFEPLGWDLQARLTPNGSKNCDAMTSDNRPVDFRFSGGWLTVNIGPKGAVKTNQSLMETVIKQPIAPFGTMFITPEQICNILGITIQGKSFTENDLPYDEREGFDWSEKTTSWQSFRYFSPVGLLNLLQVLRQQFSDVTFVHGRGEFINKIRRIKHTPVDDSHVLGELNEMQRVQFYHVCLDSMQPEKQADIYDHSVMHVKLHDYFKFICLLRIRKSGESDHVRVQFPDLEFPERFHLTFTARYQNTDSVAAGYVHKLISILDEVCFKDVVKIDLISGLPQPKVHKWEEYSFSKDLRQWCEAQSNRYLMPIAHYADSKTTHNVMCGIKPVKASVYVRCKKMTVGLN